MDPTTKYSFNDFPISNTKVPSTPQKGSAKITNQRKRFLFGDLNEVEHSFEATSNPYIKESAVPYHFSQPKSDATLSDWLSASSIQNKVEESSLKKRKCESRQVKIAQIVSDHEGKFKSLIINGVSYPITLLDEGKFHNVYIFSSDKPLVINDLDIPVSDVIIRCIKPLIGPRDIRRIYEEDFSVFEHLSFNGIPHPTIYVRPDTFEDTQFQNNGFWILQKMSEKVTVTDEDTFLFAKKWLTRSIIEKKEWIPDLYAHNLMKDNRGTLRVVDSSLPDDYEFFGERNLIESIIHWSKGGNKTALEFLLSDLPLETKNDLIAKVYEKINLLMHVEFKSNS